jgi:hypothetical protein
MASAGAFAEQGVRTTSDLTDAVEVAPASDRQAWGTTSSTVRTITTFDCDTFSPADAWSPVVGTPNRFLTSGAFECGVSAPAGAQIVRIELEACDTSASAQVNANLNRTATAGGGGAPVASVGTGVAATPGCGWFGLTLPTPETVDNLNRKYWFEATTGAANTTSLAALRVYYRLQVSPAPATATFPNDVPTSHPFFRFIEAMAASGLTGGCATNSFCPDQAVTRGQLSVFFASALGLHFPN